eukprot:m51a1_g8252 hypothetical protein (403) ;mRNA; f:142367-143711
MSDEEFLNPDDIQEQIVLDDVPGDGEPEDDDDDDAGDGMEHDDDGAGDNDEGGAASDADGDDSAPIPDDSALCFAEHTDTVLCVALQPGGDLVVSGGCDDRAFLWNVRTGDVVAELGGHTDSVAAVGFSSDGKLVATGGLDGAVRIWDAINGALVNVLEGPGEGIEWLEWHPKGPAVVAGAGDGTAWLWNGKTGAYMATYGGHGGPVQAGCIANEGRRLCTAAADGAIRVWEARGTHPEACIQGDAAATVCVASKTAPQVAVGYEDGSVVLVNTASGKKVSRLSGHSQSIEGAVFVNMDREVVATSSMDGTVRSWDVGTATERAKYFSPEVGFGRMRCHESAPLLYVAGTDGKLRVLDARDCRLLQELSGHEATIYDLAVSPSGVVVTASDDHTVRVFNTQH